MALRLYIPLRREYFDLMLSASSSYDKALLTLSYATLTLLGTLIASGKKFHCSNLLQFSCVILFLAIFFCLVSFLLAQKHAATQVYRLDDKLKEYKDKKDICGDLMFPIQIISGSFFILALFLLVIFLIANI